MNSEKSATRSGLVGRYLTVLDLKTSCRTLSASVRWKKICSSRQKKNRLVCGSLKRENREFKQIATAGATTAAVTEKVWGEYVPSVCQILQSEIERCQEHELRSSKSLLFCFL